METGAIETGEIDVIVTDGTMRALPGATGELVAQSGENRLEVSNVQGTMAYRMLAPGHYSVTVRLTGFKPRTVDDVEIEMNDRKILRLTLEPA